MPSLRRTTLLAAVFALAPLAGADEAPAPADAQAQRVQAEWTAAPGDVVLGLRLQDALCDAGRRSDAIALFRRNRAQRRADPVAGFLLGRIEGGTDGLKAMWEALDQRLGLAPGQATGLSDAWGALADAEAAAGRLSQAADASQKQAELTGTPAAWTELGGFRERSGESAAAEAAYRKAMVLDPWWISARNALSLLLARSGRRDEAITLVRATVQKMPDSAEAHIHLGLVRFLTGDRGGALVAYKKALDLAQDDPDALLVLASTYQQLEENDLAKKALERARRLSPEGGKGLVEAGALALQAGKLDEAQRTLADAAKALPTDPNVAFLQGVCSQRMGKADEAVKGFKRASTLDPANASYALAYALALEASGKVDEAIDVLEKAVAASAVSYDVVLRLGFLRMDRRKWGKAAEAFEEAVRMAPREPDPHFYLAVLYGDKMRRMDRAKEHLREYKRLGGIEASALRWLEDLEADGK